MFIKAIFIYTKANKDPQFPQEVLITPSGLQKRPQMTIMSKIRTISKVSLKLSIRINLGKPGVRAPSSRPSRQPTSPLPLKVLKGLKTQKKLKEQKLCFKVQSISLFLHIAKFPEFSLKNSDISRTGGVCHKFQIALFFQSSLGKVCRYNCA